jgi:hypothetical protein
MQATKRSGRALRLATTVNSEGPVASRAGWRVNPWAPLTRPSRRADPARGRGLPPPTARSLAWCSASIWSVPDGSGLLRWERPSIASGPDGSSRIVWMINGMMRPRDVQPSAHQATAAIVERAPDVSSGGAWWTATNQSRRAAGYKTAADRPRRAGECGPCSARRRGRPASALQSGRVAPGGMTSGMTSVPGRWSRSPRRSICWQPSRLWWRVS